MIISGLLYLGDWSHAEAIERLQEELGIQAVVTVHNHPENLKPKLPKAELSEGQKEYLMRRNHWNAETAKKYCVQRRQVVEVADRVFSAGRWPGG
ncbi:MAP kinase phosphatase 5 [Haematococcus lacustris]|uniref:MAP kinase phosphatase 5 n=2 Tax=Haematococcus lacustris TaxID=44745 RepID=A0A699YGP3_HAELA|nr:MAP kinase phosphatase 5 [Haematococcus lacustris]